MSKLLRQNQNTSRALELRIEEEAYGKYQVVLSGIQASDFDYAEKAYETLKKQFLDWVADTSQTPWIAWAE